MSRVSVRIQKSVIACDAPRCEEKIAAEGSMALLIKRARDAGWLVPQHRGSWHLCPACNATARDLRAPQHRSQAPRRQPCSGEGGSGRPSWWG